MTLLTSPLKAYVRWRHSRGYGIHSPFAYELVKMALHPGPYEFYGYEEIDRTIFGAGYKGYPKSRSDARLLLRLLVQLRTRRLLLPAGLPAMRAAAGAAGVPCVEYSRSQDLPEPQPGDMLVTVAHNVPEFEIARRIRNVTVVFAMMPSEKATAAIYEACAPHGLIFHGVRLLLAVPREEMAFVAYTMKF